MTASAIIVAAGRGVRAGGNVPKQWQLLLGKTIFSHNIDVFQKHPAITEIIVVLNHNDMAHFKNFNKDGNIKVVFGGINRAASVRNGLAVTEQNQFVLIHDVARPLVKLQTISDVLSALKNSQGAAPALPVTDAIWTVVNGQVTGTKNRSGLVRAQTPQGFNRKAIIEAHSAHQGEAPDDVTVAQAYGLNVTTVAGDEENLKITHPADFERAQIIMRGRNGR